MNSFKISVTQVRSNTGERRMRLKKTTYVVTPIVDAVMVQMLLFIPT